MSNPIDLLRDQAIKNPDNPAIFYLGNAFTYSHLLNLVQTIANKLREDGIRPGNLIAVEISNTVMHWATTLALFHEGAISCSIQSGLSVPQGVAFDFVIRDSKDKPNQGGARCILVDQYWLDEAYQAKPNIQPHCRQSEDQVCRLILSSGTTGEPKIIPLTFAQLTQRCINRNIVDPQSGPELTLFDCCSSIGFYVGIKTLMTGLPLVLGFSYEQLCKEFELFGITNLNGSPAQLDQLCAQAEKTLPITSTLRSITTSGSAITPKLIERLSATLTANITSIYGATEVGPVAKCLAIDIVANPGFSGYILPDVKVEIVDEKHAPLEKNKIGLVRIKTSHMATNYFGEPLSPDGAFINGWFYPGDLGYLREDHGLVISGRVSDLLNIGGLKINPNVIDAFLNSIEGIKDALTFEYEDQNGVNRIGSAITIEDDFNAGELPSLIAANLLLTHQPTQVVVVNEIARNQAGKPLREKMRQIALHQAN